MSRTTPARNNPQSFTFQQRPGLVTFAAIMLILLFGLHASVALMEFFASTWLLLSPGGVPGGLLWLWGIIDVLFALIPLYAAIDILRGGQVGRIIGIVIAVFSAVRWFFYLPLAPIAALVIIAIDILIIYALVAHSEYFDTSRHVATPL